MYSFFFVRKEIVHFFTFFFYCVILPLSVLVPQVYVPKCGAMYLPSIITILNLVGTPRSFHLLFYWVLFENVMSFHRTKATVMGLVGAKTAKEWVVTEKMVTTTVGLSAAAAHAPVLPLKASSAGLFAAMTVHDLILFVGEGGLQVDAADTVGSRGTTNGSAVSLIFVGIAVSYGLFSKKNDIEHHKDNYKIDNAQLYLSKLLQVSSVFDDESESESESVIEENKFEALNSQYHRGEAVVVVEEQNGAVSQSSKKPLLLPVRSLNHPLPNPNSRAGEAEDEKEVLRSPIPWRSRSGRSSDGEITSPSLNLKRSDQSTNSASCTETAPIVIPSSDSNPWKRGERKRSVNRSPIFSEIGVGNLKETLAVSQKRVLVATMAVAETVFALIGSSAAQEDSRQIRPNQFEFATESAESDRRDGFSEIKGSKGKEMVGRYVAINSIERPMSIHDFAVTEKYAVIPDMQIVLDPWLIVRGRSPVGVDREKVARFGVIPKYAEDEAESVWIEAAGFNQLHCVNA
ncbi:hypothetical protein SASPL_133646 [Salvia splendens]|uniref:Uncharacterized protein n=1 Tax=Salvia splendens TaxID=180675 RepID=A0A8X8X1Q0_SALSN|nr:hypothetical protein SASPL_133646 [Salvia splendens]